MKKRTRRGPITRALLPIPKVEGRGDKRDMYEIGPGGGWVEGDLHESFWDELYDLLLRYGGVDCDGDARLQATIVDRTKHEAFHFQPVASTGMDSTLAQRVAALNIHMLNVSTATSRASAAARLLEDQVARELRELKG